MGNICLEPDRKNNQMDDHASDHGVEEAKSGEVMERGTSASSHHEGKTVWNLTDKQKDDCENIFGVFEEEDGEYYIFTTDALLCFFYTLHILAHSFHILRPDF
jgi:hypothetical protein